MIYSRVFRKELIIGFIVSFFVISLSLSFSFAFAGDIASPFNKLVLKSGKDVSNYLFLVGGHLYGAPRNNASVFPSPSIIAAVNMINGSRASFFVSLGDNFRRSRLLDMLNFKAAFSSQVTIPIFNAVGNHDVRDRLLYEKQFGRKTYFDFVHGTELFIFLDTELVKGEIKDRQLEYFQSLLQSIKDDSKIRNVFIFSHKLIWSAYNPNYKIVFDHLNSKRGYPLNNRNFKYDIEPYLTKLSLKKVYWFSGDIGCSHSLTFFYDKQEKHNITYIATGLGDMANDAIIEVRLDKKGEVKFTPLSLTGQELPPLNYYSVDYWETHFNRQGQIEKFFKKVLKMIRHRYFLMGFFSALFLFCLCIIVLYLYNRKD